MAKDPRETLDMAPMGLLQILIVGLTCLLNGLDGFDVLSISFASPGIATEWGVDRGALGIVLSMELIGMTIGAIVFGGIADRTGRRKTSLVCMAIMALGMLLTTFVGSVFQLSMCRIFTGIGLGGLLSAITPLAAEFANRKRRHMSVAIMSIGYPIGGVIGGSIAAQLLVNHSWRSVFYLGAGVTALFIPVFFFLVPESVYWLVRKQPQGALKKVNAALRRLGHEPVDALPEIELAAQKKTMSAIFAPGMASITTIVTIAYFLQITSYYFILKWVPKVVADLGFTVSEAGNVLVFANIGGAVGGAIFGFLTLRYSPKILTLGTMMMGGLFIALFGSTPIDLVYMSAMAFLCGFFGNATIVGMFTLFAHVFPTHMRASGLGFCVGLGRGAGILSPIIVGFLFQCGFSLPSVTVLISIGAFAGAAVLFFLKMRENEE